MRFSLLPGGALALICWTSTCCAQARPLEVKALFNESCAACHGARGEGGAGGSLVVGAWKHGDGSDEHLARIIAEGVPAQGMPAFGQAFSPALQRALLVYVRELRAEALARERAPSRPEGDMAVASREHNFRVETVAEGLEVPWSLTFLPPENHLLLTERAGRLRLVVEGKLQADPIFGTPEVAARGQGGLLAVAAHPDYRDNGWVYLAYSDAGEDAATAMTRIVRGKIRAGRWDDQQDIFRAEARHYTKPGHHYGVRLVFADGYLFFGIGDRGAQDQAQDLGQPNGKIHRVHDDGRVPDDNPFVGTPGALPTIWTLGVRNPQGLALRNRGESWELWETEHGPRGGDELNFIQRGANYGWPLITYGINYNGTPVGDGATTRAGLEQPVTHWTPSIAVSALAFYSGERFPLWHGDVLMGSLAKQELWRLVLRDHVVVDRELLFQGIGQIRDLTVGPDGLCYLALQDPDRVVRLVPAR
jgi:aldose sugar dehydrogenase